MNSINYTKIWAMLIMSAGAFAILFLAYPQIDVIFSDLFFTATGSFALAENAALITIRDLFKLLFAVTFLFAILMLALSFIRRGERQVARQIWLFILGAYVLGPGVLVNMILKNNWGRARPANIQAFGGDALFTPPLLIADQCPTNCSFVSGETSTIATLSILTCCLFWISASANMRKILVTIAVIMTAIASLLRIAMGRHFLSDTIFSSLFCALIILALFQLLQIERHRTKLTPFAMISDLKRVFRAGNSPPKN